MPTDGTRNSRTTRETAPPDHRWRLSPWTIGRKAKTTRPECKQPRMAKWGRRRPWNALYPQPPCGSTWQFCARLKGLISKYVVGLFLAFFFFFERERGRDKGQEAYREAALFQVASGGLLKPSLRVTSYFLLTELSWLFCKCLAKWNSDERTIRTSW